MLVHQRVNPSKTIYGRIWSIGWCVCVCVVGARSCRYGIFTYKTDQNCTPKVDEKFTGKPQTEWQLPGALKITWKLQQQFQIFRYFAVVKFVYVPSIRGSYWGKQKQEFSVTYFVRKSSKIYMHSLEVPPKKGVAMSLGFTDPTTQALALLL